MNSPPSSADATSCANFQPADDADIITIFGLGNLNQSDYNRALIRSAVSAVPLEKRVGKSKRTHNIYRERESW